MANFLSKRGLFNIGKILLFGFILFAIWYKITFSMGVSNSYEVNDPNSTTKVLINTQKSEYKDSLTNQIVSYLDNQQVYIKVTDVNNINAQKLNDYTAIIVICSIEYGHPPAAIREFLENSETLDKTLFFNTSGGGDVQLLDVDGISGASILSSIETDKSKIISWIKPFLELK